MCPRHLQEQLCNIVGSSSKSASGHLAMDGPVGTEDSSAKATNRTTRPQGTELHSHAWHIQRLLFIAAEKESIPECPMASMNKFPAAPFVLIVTNFLCTPPHIFSHPLASQGCRMCFTPVCDECHGKGRTCACGGGDFRKIRGGSGFLPCSHAKRGVCKDCSSPVKDAWRCCRGCGVTFVDKQKGGDA